MDANTFNINIWWGVGVGVGVSVGVRGDLDN